MGVYDRTCMPLCALPLRLRDCFGQLRLLPRFIISTSVLGKWTEAKLLLS